MATTGRGRRDRLRRVLSTIGYEGCRLDQVVGRLSAAGVRLLVDVRALPLSRKPGFSKRQLAATLDEHGIAYLHLRDLGTPKPGRVAARAGRTGEMRHIFAGHMAQAPAQAALLQAIALVRQTPCCLLCYEADHRLCHRDMVAEMITAATGQPAEHLAA